MVRELAQRLPSGADVNANRIGLGPPTRDDYLVQEMMALMREAARERGARYEIPWLKVVVERRPCRR